MRITIDNLIHKYIDFVSLNNINLEVREGELIALLGPSGCGKTTLLKAIAGLTDVYSGKILLGDTEITNLAPQQRKIALVFQNYALFPHMTVAENIEYGLKVKKVKGDAREIKVNEVLEIVKLEGYEERKIHELSGGQQQRVALARALVIEPQVLLFDEPLSNLDERLRVTMREEIRRIQKKLGITSVYVTHDQEEAMAIADRIAVMRDGVILQVSPSAEAYSHPENEFVARFMGAVNILPYELIKVEEKVLKLRVFNEEVSVGLDNGFLDYKDTINIDETKFIDQYSLMIRPENIEFTGNAGLCGTVKWVEYLGSIIKYVISLKSYEFIIVDINRGGEVLKEGDHIGIRFNWEKAKFLTRLR